MKIYITDSNPYMAAGHLDDVRVTLAFFDVYRLLSTVAYYDGSQTNLTGYLPMDHPLVRWCQNSRDHVWWLMAYGFGLQSEYYYRYKRTHQGTQSFTRLLDFFGYQKPEVLGFLNLAKNKERGVDYSQVSDPIKAYRYYLNERWSQAIAANLSNPRKRIPQWSNSKTPDWYDF